VSYTHKFITKCLHIGSNVRTYFASKCSYLQGDTGVEDSSTVRYIQSWSAHQIPKSGKLQLTINCSVWMPYFM